MIDALRISYQIYKKKIYKNKIEMHTYQRFWSCSYGHSSFLARSLKCLIFYDFCFFWCYLVIHFTFNCKCYIYMSGFCLCSTQV